MYKIKIYPNLLVSIQDNDVNYIGITSLYSVTQQIKSSEKYCVTKRIYKYIEADLEGIFKNTSFACFPQASFQYLALARLSEKSWQDMSLELGIPAENLGSFFQNCCQTFAVKFKQDIQVPPSENI